MLNYIKSFYHLNNKYIVCPKGKYHPTYFYDQTYSHLTLSSFKENGDWELKCYHHYTGYFLVFYLMNGSCQFFRVKIGSSDWVSETFHNEIYDFKLNNGNDNGEYLLAYVVNKSNLKLIGAKFTFNNDGVYRDDCGGEKSLTDALTYSRGCFENSNDHFYFLTYSNTDDFKCGYYDSSDSINYLSVESYSATINTDSPLEFVDEVEIKEIKFIYNYKYAYYTIYNPTNQKTYRGIIDTKKNVVVFNTDEEILTYIPYSDISMLAITATKAYEICVIKKDGKCIDSLGCDTTNSNYILDLEGNKCANSCDSGKILLIRENFCSDTCDESIYVLYTDRSNNKICGLCKNYNSDKPFKIINTQNYLSESEIPEGAEVYNSKLNLLKCKSGYKLEGETCITNCYKTCQTCSDYSEDETNQKCETCKTEYIKDDNNNCITQKIKETTNIVTTIIPSTKAPTTQEIVPTTT